MQLTLEIPDEAGAALSALAASHGQPPEELAASALVALALGARPLPDPASPDEAESRLDLAHELRPLARAVEDAYDTLRDQLARWFLAHELSGLRSAAGRSASLQTRRRVPAESLPEAVRWLKERGRPDLVQVKETLRLKELDRFLATLAEPAPDYFRQFTHYVMLGR